jgi:L-fuconolactonase
MRHGRWDARRIADVRIDAHQHFWRYNQADLPWITAEMSVLMADHLPENLAPILAAEEIDGTILVQARHSEDETRWLIELADQNPFIRGVVGWVDLSHCDVDERLQRMQHPKLRGIRHILQDEPDPDFMLHTAFRSGISRLADHGLTYDLLLFPAYLRGASTLVAEHSHVSFVLDHLGKPPVLAGRDVPRGWRDDLRRLADHGNVMCKISGMVTEAVWSDWSPEDFNPYLDAVMSSFGPDRVMFGTDWPVCLLASDYAGVLGIVEQYAKEMTPEHREALLGGNAARFYGLDP